MTTESIRPTIHNNTVVGEGEGQSQEGSNQEGTGWSDVEQQNRHLVLTKTLAVQNAALVKLAESYDKDLSNTEVRETLISTMKDSTEYKQNILEKFKLERASTNE